MNPGAQLGNFQTSVCGLEPSPIWNSSRGHFCPECGVVSPEVPCRRVLDLSCPVEGHPATSLGMQRSFGKWGGTMACSFPAVPRGRVRKPDGKEPWLLSHPGSVLGTVKTCCVFSLEMNFYQEITGASLSAALPGSFQSREPAASTELAPWLDVGVPGSYRASGMSHCSMASGPTFSPVVWVFFPHKIAIIQFSLMKGFLLLSEIAPWCPGSRLALR